MGDYKTWKMRYMNDGDAEKVNIRSNTECFISSAVFLADSHMNSCGKYSATLQSCAKTVRNNNHSYNCSRIQSLIAQSNLPFADLFNRTPPQLLWGVFSHATILCND